MGRDKPEKRSDDMKAMKQAREKLPDWLRGRSMPDGEYKAEIRRKLDDGPCPYRFCDGSGDVPAVMSIDGLASRGIRRCPCQEDRRRQEAFEDLMRAGNMEAYKHMTFEASEGKYPHQADAFRLTQGDPEGFYIFGPVGSGKTRLLACLVNREIEAGRPAALITVPQLLAASHEVKGGISDLERQACRVPYLALDDIGKERMEGFRASEARDMLFRLMDARSLLRERGLGHTSFSSQWPRDKYEGTAALEDNMDPAVVSRIRGMTIKVFLNGPDLRAGR